MPQENVAAADGEIAQAAAHERDHFVAPRFRADEIRLLVVQLQELVLKRRKLEEVIFFAHRFRGTAALGAGSAGADRIHVEFVEDAILAGVVSLVDVAVVADAPPQRLHALLVLGGSWCG